MRRSKNSSFGMYRSKDSPFGNKSRKSTTKTEKYIPGSHQLKLDDSDLDFFGLGSSPKDFPSTSPPPANNVKDDVSKIAKPHVPLKNELISNSLKDFFLASPPNNVKDDVLAANVIKSPLKSELSSPQHCRFHGNALQPPSSESAASTHIEHAFRAISLKSTEKIGPNNNLYEDEKPIASCQSSVSNGNGNRRVLAAARTVKKEEPPIATIKQRPTLKTNTLKGPGGLLTRQLCAINGITASNKKSVFDLQPKVKELANLIENFGRSITLNELKNLYLEHYGENLTEEKLASILGVKSTNYVIAFNSFQPPIFNCKIRSNEEVVITLKPLMQTFSQKTASHYPKQSINKTNSSALSISSSNYSFNKNESMVSEAKRQKLLSDDEAQRTPSAHIEMGKNELLVQPKRKKQMEKALANVTLLIEQLQI